MNVDSQSRPARRAGAQASWVGKDFILLDPLGKTLRGLNPVAARVWELSDGTRSVAQIAAQIAETWKLEPGRALEDVLAFVGQLGARELIDVAA